MFSSFTARVCSEIETVKRVLETNDRVRNFIFLPPPSNSCGQSAAAEPAPYPNNISTAQVEQTAGASDERAVSLHLKALEEMRAEAPSRLAWQVYDRCAAFTRLYAIFEQFVHELVSDYLRVIPSLYEKYEELPEELVTQHRLGIGQILLKLGKEGPYKHLDEATIIGDLAQGLAGGLSYKLLRDAFLIDPQNYRATALVRLFGYLGIKDCWSWVEKHPLVSAFMERERDKNETAATVLHDLVEYRNEAAHGSVTETVSIEELKSIADCIIAVCEALAQLMMRQIILRREKLGQAILIGDVIHKFSNRVVGVRVRGGVLALGDELVVVHRHACYNVRVQSIQIGQTAYEHLDLTNNHEIGLRLSLSANEGARLIRLPEENPVAAEASKPEVLSADEYPIGSPEQAPPEID